MRSTAQRSEGDDVVVDGGVIAAELRRRRLGRNGLAERVANAPGSTWLPGEGGSLRHTGNDLLVLAALSLLGPGRPGPRRPGAFT